MTNEQLVQCAMIWYTKIEMTPLGVLREFETHTASQLKDMSVSDLRTAMIVELIHRSSESGSTFHPTSYGYYWTATNNPTKKRTAWYFDFHESYGVVERYWYDKEQGFSVRYIKK